jgi:hypothetical protein
MVHNITFTNLQFDWDPFSNFIYLFILKKKSLSNIKNAIYSVLEKWIFKINGRKNKIK